MPYCEKCNVNTSSSGINSNVCSGSSLNPNLGVDFIYIGSQNNYYGSWIFRLARFKKENLSFDPTL